MVAHFTHPCRMAALVLSRCCPGSTTLSSLLHGLSDCFHAILFTSAMLEFMPCATRSCLMVRLRCRFIQAVAALSLIPSSVALLLMLVVGFRCVFYLISVFLFPRSLTLDRHCFSISSLRPSSLTGPSPCVFPAGAYWLLVEGEGLEPPTFGFGDRRSSI